MTVRHMRIFLEVYRTENITRAAENLYMTQPTVTRAIQELEQYYGICLFERLNRRLYITDAGREFYSYALHVVDSLDQMEQGMRNWDHLGQLRIGTTITIGNFRLPQILADFRLIYPGIRVRSRVANSAVLQQALLDNEIDFAVVEGSVERERLMTEEIQSDHLVLIVPPNDPITRRERLLLQDLQNEPMLLREAGSAGRTFLNYVFGAHGLTLVPTMESASTQAIVQAVHRGLGISFLPEQLVHHDIARGIVDTRTVDDEPFRRKNYLVWHKNKHLTKAAKSLMDLFREQTGRDQTV